MEALNLESNSRYCHLTITSNNITMTAKEEIKELRHIAKVLAIIGIIVSLAMIGVNHYAKQHHTCTDPTHEKCDGECPCDGFECPPIKADSHAIQQCDYHMTILNDTYIMFTEDGDTVKVFKYGEFPILDSVVDADNL